LLEQPTRQKRALEAGGAAPEDADPVSYRRDLLAPLPAPEPLPGLARQPRGPTRHRPLAWILVRSVTVRA